MSSARMRNRCGSSWNILSLHGWNSSRVRRRLAQSERGWAAPGQLLVGRTKAILPFRDGLRRGLAPSRLASCCPPFSGYTVPLALTTLLSQPSLKQFRATSESRKQRRHRHAHVVAYLRVALAEPSHIIHGLFG